MSKFQIKSTLGRGANEAWEAGDVVSAEELGEENVSRLVELGVIVSLEEQAASAPKKRGGKN